MRKEDTVVSFSVTQTGYDSKPTDFEIRMKHQGTAPDITVWAGGQYPGKLTLSQRGARELVNALKYLIGDEKETS